MRVMKESWTFQTYDRERTDGNWDLLFWHAASLQFIIERWAFAVTSERCYLC